MNVEKTKLDGVFILTPKIFQDDRGFVFESYSQRIFIDNGLNYNFIQDNHSFNKHKNTFRGLHYQKHPKAQSMLVRVVSGAVIDFVVDIRKNSPTFGQYIKQTLSDKNNRQILISKGFAHGFLTLRDSVIISYKFDEFYAPEFEGILNFKGIISEVNMNNELIVADKDKDAPSLDEIDNNFYMVNK